MHPLRQSRLTIRRLDHELDKPWASADADLRAQRDLFWNICGSIRDCYRDGVRGIHENDLCELSEISDVHLSTQLMQQRQRLWEEIKLLGQVDSERDLSEALIHQNACMEDWHSARWHSPASVLFKTVQGLVVSRQKRLERMLRIYIGNCQIAIWDFVEIVLRYRCPSPVSRIVKEAWLDQFRKDTELAVQGRLGDIFYAARQDRRLERRFAELCSKAEAQRIRDEISQSLIKLARESTNSPDTCHLVSEVQALDLPPHDLDNEEHAAFHANRISRLYLQTIAGELEMNIVELVESDLVVGAPLRAFSLPFLTTLPSSCLRGIPAAFVEQRLANHTLLMDRRHLWAKHTELVKQYPGISHQSSAFADPNPPTAGPRLTSVSRPRHPALTGQRGFHMADDRRCPHYRGPTNAVKNDVASPEGTTASTTTSTTSLPGSQDSLSASEDDTTALSPSSEPAVSSKKPGLSLQDRAQPPPFQAEFDVAGSTPSKEAQAQPQPSSAPLVDEPLISLLD